MPTLVGRQSKPCLIVDALWSIGKDAALTCGLCSLLDIRIITCMCDWTISSHRGAFSVQDG